MLSTMRKARMIRRLHILMQRRQRQRRAVIIQNNLAMAGYRASDLVRIAALRATVDPALAIAAVPSDPSCPTLAEVLDVWQRLYAQPIGASSKR